MNDWGYVDPAEQAHEQWQQPWAQQQQQPYPAQPVQSPLAGLDQAVPQIMNAAGYPRYEDTAERMLVGGLLGALLGWLLGNRRKQRCDS